MPGANHCPQDRVDILGVRVSAIDLDQAANIIAEWIDQGRRTYVCVTGAHGVLESRADATLREVHNAADMVTPDGMPLVWFARLLGWSRTRRVYGPDLMRRLTALSADRGYRQFYYGGAENVAERLRESLLHQYPRLQVAGTCCPPFRPPTEQEDQDVVARINAARPDIVWVGLSTPKQEVWMARHRDRITAPVMIGVGAAFDFLAGTKPQAPLWMQRNGLEWAFRLGSEPRRLWRRYAYIVPMFTVLAIGALARRLLAVLPEAAARASASK